MYPYRKQFTMPKRLPSTNYDNMLETGIAPDSDHDSFDPSNQDFTEEELRILQNEEV